MCLVKCDVCIKRLVKYATCDLLRPVDLQHTHSTHMQTEEPDSGVKASKKHLSSYWMFIITFESVEVFFFVFFYIYTVINNSG